MMQISRKLTESWKSLLSVLLCCFVMAISPAYAQTTSVKGVVSDAMGPTAGVNVVEKGTTNGTITDIDGNFEIKVKPNATLVFSFVGMDTQEVAVNGRKNIEVFMQGSEELDEVIVVGYGTQKKSDITGSVASVDKDRLSKIPVTNVLQAVQGATAGITITQSSSIPGDAPSALVRGNNSITASNSPYIVVDGVPLNNTGGSLNDIAPSDIESMEILKDASATAIYGTNGSNGVILITTKHGKDGAPKVKYSGYIGFDDFSNRLTFADGKTMTKRYKDYVAQNAGESMVAENYKYANEKENYEAGKEIDWVYDIASQTGVTTDHNVSISGGAEKVKYYMSLDYMDQKGVLKGFNYKRYSFRANLDANVTDYLKIGTSSYFASHNKDGGRVNFLNAEAMSPYAKLYEEDGSYTHYPMYSESLWANPMLGTTKDAERRQWNLSLNGYAELNFGKIWAPLQGLSYKFNAGFSYAPKRDSSYTGREAYDENGTASIFNSETQTYTVENILNYDRDFGKSHLGVTLLYAASRKKYNENTAKAVGFVNDNLSFGNLGNGATASVASYSDLYTTLSQMGRINYSYDSRYLLTLTARRDGSSKFGKNNKYGVFPSAALGWNLSRESFMESTQSWLDDLKLRFSYGLTGNEAISVYQTIMKLASSSYAMGGAKVTSFYPSSTMGNDDLSWEKTKTTNIGIDMAVLRNRITLSADMYWSNTTDLLLARNLPKLSGFSTVYSNMGEVKGNGIEITLNTKNIVKKDFTWSTALVFSHSHDEIVDLYGDGKDDLGNKWFIGEPIGVVYDYDMVGIWQEDEIAAGLHKNWDPTAQAGDVKLADRNGDGQINADDKHVVGQTAPKWTAGLTNTFTYKGLSLSIFFQTVQGLRKNNNLIGVAADEMGRRNSPTCVGYWTAENKSNEFRSLSKTSNRHGYGFNQDASYTRLKDVTLGYQLPENIVKNLHIAALQVYVNAKNPFTWSDWTGWDPEARQDGRGWGNWENNYPMTKSYTVGLNVTF